MIAADHMLVFLGGFSKPILLFELHIIIEAIICQKQTKNKQTLLRCLIKFCGTRFPRWPYQKLMHARGHGEFMKVKLCGIFCHVVFLRFI